jgi:hypothetical protein
MSSYRNISTHLGVIEFIMRLRQSHDAEGNTQGTHSIPHTDKLNFANAVGLLPKYNGILTGTGMVLRAGFL